MDRFGRVRPFALLLCCGGTFALNGARAQVPVPASSSPTAASVPSQEEGIGSTASITGLVTDVNGGVVPGAAVVLLGVDGRELQRVEADAEGTFRVAGLVAGRYRLRIEAAGLQTFEAPAISLKPGELFKLEPTALPIATASQSVDVVMTRTEIAEEELHEETRQRVLGVLPNFYTSYVWDAAPLNARQKLKLSFRASTDPWVFARTGITAGIQQAQGTYPAYGPGPTGFARRYGAAYGEAVTGRVIGSAVLPAVFHQDPRYFYRGTGGFGRRTLHALVSSVAARTDAGHIEPNYTHLLGDFMSGYLSRTWHPGSNNGISLALGNTLFGVADAAGHNLAQEFLFKRISRGTPPYARGKPPEEHESAAHP